MMEKVWEGLRKIESQAEQIRNEAKDKAKKMTILAQQEADKLVANSKAYAEEEALELYDDEIEEANRSRNEQLIANRESAEKLRVKADKRMDQASSKVVNIVLGETIY
jgi:vacuolar-type H+-ATPase subunit H